MARNYYSLFNLSIFGDKPYFMREADKTIQTRPLKISNPDLKEKLLEHLQAVKYLRKQLPSKVKL